ncbi:MAG: ABC transporter permease [Bryobacteraceae bacterium]
MRKILLIAKRDYLASIRTKAFLFGLVVAPVLFGGSFIGIALMKNKPDIRDKRIAIVDRTGAAAASVIEAVRERNEQDLFDKTKGRQTMPRYRFENVPPADENPGAQLLALSDRVRRGDLSGFIEIGARALQPRKTAAESSIDDGISWYANESGFGEARHWLAAPLNDGLRRVRLAKLGVDPSHFEDVLGSVPVESMSLVSRDAKTGRISEARKKGQVETFAIPFGLMMLLAMIVMLTSAPMLPGIAEDKMQRVFEMLLASATPFELIAGKIAAAVGRSLTSSVLYIGAGVLVMNSMAMMGLLPFQLLPWFVIYLVAEVTMLCAFASALGAACGSPQDAQSLGVVLMTPVMIPLFLMMPVLQQPNSAFATVLSLLPPFTPLLMLMRQALPGGVPAWQPWVGLAGIAIGTAAIAWVAARIFRVAILLQGKPPNMAELARWAVHG